MSYVDTIRQINSALLHEAGTGLDDLQKRGPRLIRALAKAGPPGRPIQDYLEDKAADVAIVQLERMIANLRDAVELASTLNDYLGSPDRLRAIASGLRQRVVDPCDDLAPQLRHDNLHAMVPSAWDDGDASAMYSMGFDGQRDAVQDAATAAVALAGSLESMADGVEDFYRDVAWACFELAGAVVGLIAGIVAAVSVIGILAAIVALGTLGHAIDALHDAATQHRGEPVGDKVRALSWPTARFAGT